MNPTPDAINAIIGQVTDWLQTDQQIVDQLNTPSEQNSVAQVQIPTNFGMSDLLALITTAANVLSLMQLPSFEAELRALVNKLEKTPDDIVNLNNWAQGLSAGGILTPAEYVSIAGPSGLFNKTQLDPTWQALLPWSTVTLGRLVDLEDIAVSRAVYEGGTP